MPPDGWLLGRLEFADGRIATIDGEHTDPARNDQPYILPGFIDLHVYGGGGADVMDGGTAVNTIARAHARHGTTSLLATTMTAPREQLKSVIAGLGTLARERQAGAPRDCWACIWRVRTSILASSVSSRWQPRSRCSTKSSSIWRWTPSASSRWRPKSPGTWTSYANSPRAGCAFNSAIRLARIVSRRLADGTLAGSTLTMDQALRNLVSIGLPIADVSARLSRHAADYLGLVDRGRIERGAWADLVVIDRELTLVATYVEGEAVVE